MYMKPQVNPVINSIFEDDGKLAEIIHAMAAKKPIHSRIFKEICNIPLTPEESQDKYLTSIMGATCRIRYTHERRQEEKAAETMKAIRCRERRKKKK